MVCRAGPPGSRQARARTGGRAGHRCRLRAGRDGDAGPAPGRAIGHGARSRAGRCSCAGAPPWRGCAPNDRGIPLPRRHHLPGRPGGPGAAGQRRHDPDLRRCPRRMLPGPVGDLEAARRASGAPDVVAYVADPAAPISGTGSCAWAEIAAADGNSAVAELMGGEGLRATAAIAAETAARVLAGVGPGAWTAGRLLGPALVAGATGAQVTVDGRPA